MPEEQNENLHTPFKKTGFFQRDMSIQPHRTVNNTSISPLSPLIYSPRSPDQKESLQQMKLRSKNSYNLQKQRAENMEHTVRNFFDNQKLYLKSGVKYTISKKGLKNVQSAEKLEMMSQTTF